MTKIAKNPGLQAGVLSIPFAFLLIPALESANYCVSNHINRSRRNRDGIAVG